MVADEGVAAAEVVVVKPIRRRRVLGMAYANRCLGEKKEDEAHHVQAVEILRVFLSATRHRVSKCSYSMRCCIVEEGSLASALISHEYRTPN